MKKPGQQRSQGRWGLALLLVAALVTLFSLGPSQAQGLQWFFSGEEGDRLSEEDLEALQAVYQSIQGLYVEDVDKDQVMEGALKGMVEAIGDEHSEFLNPDQSQDMVDDMEGSFEGIGVQFMLENGVPTVITPIEGTPAAEVGVQPNDQILKADGVDLIGLDTHEIVNLIRGPKGEPVLLEIQRGSASFEVEIQRAEIPIITVTGELAADHPNIGIISLNQFNGTSYDEWVTEIESLRDQGAEAFVFDFRFNPGGLLDQALAISNSFVQDGDVILQVEEKEGHTVYEASDARYGDLQIHEPYALLINGGSASASEIVAAVVKEHTDRPLIGTTSFGKGSVQTMLDFTPYGQLKLTFAKWLTPSGQWIQSEGVSPTLEVQPHPLQEAILVDGQAGYAEGSAGDGVETITLVLSSLGYLEDSQSHFDQGVSQALKAYQKDHDLKATGAVDEATAQALNRSARDYLKAHDLQLEAALDYLLQDLDSALEPAA